MNENPPVKWTPTANNRIGKTKPGANFNANNPTTNKKNMLKPIVLKSI